FLPIPAIPSPHPYPFRSGSWLVVSLSADRPDRSTTRAEQALSGSGIVRYGGAWRGSFPLVSSNSGKKKKSATAPYPWPLPLVAGLPLVTSLSQLPPGPTASGPTPPSTHLCSLSLAATATSRLHATPPWSTPILWRLFL
ncbi:hypothetical protein CORC01_07103, partial [Colletotrichum orchidophilum]